MFGMGWPEMALIAVVGVLLFGPDKLPDFARQAAQLTRNLRRMAQDAKADLNREFEALGGDLGDLAGLDPRDIVRNEILDDPSDRTAARPLRPGERPPFDAEAT